MLVPAATPSLVWVAKLGMVTVTLYGPSPAGTTLNLPSEPVNPVLEPPEPETTTVAPGRVPPDSSTTAPVMAAPCAKADAAMNRTATAARIFLITPREICLGSARGRSPTRFLTAVIPQFAGGLGHESAEVRSEGPKAASRGRPRSRRLRGPGRGRPSASGPPCRPQSHPQLE